MKFGQIFYTSPVSDFPSGSICSVQIDASFVQSRLGTYSPWTRAERRFLMLLNESDGNARIRWNGDDQLRHEFRGYSYLKEHTRTQ